MTLNYKDEDFKKFIKIFSIDPEADIEIEEESDDESKEVKEL